jgi:hypothetical protein
VWIHVYIYVSGLRRYVSVDLKSKVAMMTVTLAQPDPVAMLEIDSWPYCFYVSDTHA